MKNKSLVFSIALSIIAMGCGGSQTENQDSAASTPASTTPAVRRVLGDNTTWKNWINFETAMINAEGGVELSTFQEFLLPVSADELQGRKLVYEAQLLEGEKVPMRMQINWKDSNGGYVSTDLVLAYPTSSMGTFSMNIYPPKKAATGDIYGILHDQGPKGKILLKSVYLD